MSATYILGTRLRKSQQKALAGSEVERRPAEFDAASDRGIGHLPSAALSLSLQRLVWSPGLTVILVILGGHTG